MFQVLLVDDEPLARHHLASLADWRKHGFEMSGEASNGATALTMIERSPPHVAIIDVNMPEMNGVELHRAIRERFPAVKTIMLSSYDDYDYVRECLKNGAVDYLLKHRLDDATLLASLKKAVLDVRQGKRIPHGGNVDGIPEEPPNPQFIRDSIADLARGEPNAAREFEAYARQSGLFPNSVRYVAAALQIIPFLLLTESYSDVQTNRLVRQVVDIMQQSLGDVRERMAAYVGNGRIVVAFGFKERSEHAATSEAGRWMAKIKHALDLYLNLKCVYALGHVCGSLPQLGASYGSAERALGDSPSAKPPSAAYNPRISLSIEEQKQLLLSIERLDKEGTMRVIASVFASLRDQSVHSRAVQMIVSELLHIADKAIGKWMPAPASEEGGPDALPSRRELGNVGSIGELERWLQAYYGGLLKLLKRREGDGPYSRHVSQAIQLIMEKYPGHVTLELAAGAIGLNPSYLSRIFKEETHSTFSEYLNRVRIAAGRKLLESGLYSVKQISGQVGFATHNYFFKVFKEMTGMTPHAYLNSLGRGDEP